jgi:hypothetical protein
MDTQAPFGWENFSCTVTDDVGVDRVRLIITDPHGVVSNISMTHKVGTDTYYYRTSYSQYGNYSYFFWAMDTSGNSVCSNNNKLSLPSNWDINKDGKCNVLDQIAISSHYGQTGTTGWIREDVDNNGRIQVLDLIYFSTYYGESWWD